MSRNKNRRKRNKTRYRHRVNNNKSRVSKFSVLSFLKTRKVLSFLSGSGILLVLISLLYNLIGNNVNLEYIGDVDRAYEFQLTNNTPADKTIVSFRILPINQNLIFEFTEDVYVTANKDGSVILPDGGISYIPAAELNELDGLELPSHASKTFRVPPLSNNKWLKPSAFVTDVVFELQYSNILLRLVEKVLSFFYLHSSEQTIRYLVVDNYWIRAQSDSKDEALRIYCRDNGKASNPDYCDQFDSP